MNGRPSIARSVALAIVASVMGDAPVALETGRLPHRGSRHLFRPRNLRREWKRRKRAGR